MRRIIGLSPQPIKRPLNAPFITLECSHCHVKMQAARLDSDPQEAVTALVDCPEHADSGETIYIDDSGATL